MLFRQVRAIHEDILQLKQLSDALADGKVGHVRFGVVPALGESVIANAIATARQDAPDLKISVEVLNSHELVHMVQSDRLDFACIFGPLTDLPVEVIFRRDVELMCVGPSDMLEERFSINLNDYARYPLALMRPTDPIGRMLQRNCDKVGVTIKSTIELRNCRAAIAFAKSEVALGIADAFSIADTDLGSAKAIPFDPPLRIELAIVRKVERLDTVAERSVVRSLEEAISKGDATTLRSTD